jgi:hypothetical protein
MVKDLGNLEYFVGCRMIEDTKDKYKSYIHQPNLLKHLTQDFTRLIGKPKIYRTSAVPKPPIMRPEKGDVLISSKEQTFHRSVVGIL